MSFSQEVGQFFALSLSQSARLEQALSALQHHLHHRKQNFPSTPEQSEQEYQHFVQVIATFGLTAEQIPSLMEHLYAMPEFRVLVKRLIDCFYQAGGDREQFNELYQQILMDEQI